jgi:hypothetical protein
MACMHACMLGSCSSPKYKIHGLTLSHAAPWPCMNMIICYLTIGVLGCVIRYSYCSKLYCRLFY